jgi:large subunit ribosomal protein L32e
MKDTQRLLEQRIRMKKKKPTFLRQEAQEYVRLGSGWKRPRGKSSKLRLHKKGTRKSISVGYKSPIAVKFMHYSGLMPRLIASLKEVQSIDTKKEGIIISGKVGIRHKIEIIKEAQKLGVRILNLKDPQKFLQAVEDDIKKKKEEKEKVSQDKKKKLKEREDKAKEKSEKKEEKTEELADKVKEEEKKEQDKLLTKRT